MDLKNIESTKLLDFCKSGNNNIANSTNNKNSDSNKNHIASTSNNNTNYKENQKNNYNSQNDIECSSSISCNSVSSSSISSVTSSTSKIFNNSNNNSTSSNSSSQYNNSYSTINNNKRKRRATLDDKDNELDNSTHPAKRPQIMPSLSVASSASKASIISITSTNSYEHNNIQSDSQSSSVSSSYLGDDLPNEIDTRSCSSECLSTVAEYDIGTPSPEGEETLISPSLSDSSSIMSSMSHHQQDQYRTLTGDNTTKWEIIADNVRGDKTPHSEKQRYTKSFIEFEATRSLTPIPETRACPLPLLSWANSADVWNAMCRKDELATKERHSTMLDNHPGLQPRMRAILLDWLIEVCEVYKLHRETYYLAVDYLDRYLSTQTKVSKTHLQLIGITCLFVAAKVEEIYPPKIGEFAYVTDGACQEEDIINYELLLLNALNWNISTVTIVGWLSIYMQLNASSRTAASFINSSKNSSNFNWINENHVNKKELGHNNNNNNNNSINSNNNNNNCSNLFKQVQDKNFINFKDINNIKNNIKDNSTNNFKDNSTNNNYNNNCSSNGEAAASTSSANNNNNTNLTVNDSGISITDGNTDDAFIYPQFSGLEFVQTVQIIDLCTLDLGLSDYPYSVIAAAAISHTFGRETAMRVSGYEWNVIVPCARWMEPYFQIISEESQHLNLLEQNEQVQSKYGLGHICPNIVTDDSHIIQTHTTSMTMFDKALLRREQYQTSILAMIKQESSPAVTGSHRLYPEGLLTPPSSNRKPVDNENIENVPDLRNIQSTNIS